MIYNFLSEYLSIIIFLFLALFLSIGFIVANFLASPSNPDPEKLSAYECGFEAFDDSRMEFDVRFYLIGAVSSVGRASRLHREGHRFESFTAHH